MTDIKDLTNPDTLVDINDISVNKDLPKPERIKEYIRQIKNPYCDKFIYNSCEYSKGKP